MKSFAYSVGWFTVSILVLYLPLCFSALSFNPFEWNHIERFIFAMVIWIGIAGYYLKKIVPVKYSL